MLVWYSINVFFYKLIWISMNQPPPPKKMTHFLRHRLFKRRLKPPFWNSPIFQRQDRNCSVLQIPADHDDGTKDLLWLTKLEQETSTAKSWELRMERLNQGSNCRRKSSNNKIELFSIFAVIFLGTFWSDNTNACITRFHIFVVCTFIFTL